MRIVTVGQCSTHTVGRNIGAKTKRIEQIIRINTERVHEHTLGRSCCPCRACIRVSLLHKFALSTCWRIVQPIHSYCGLCTTRRLVTALRNARESLTTHSLRFNIIFIAVGHMCSCNQLAQTTPVKFRLQNAHTHSTLSTTNTGSIKRAVERDCEYVQQQCMPNTVFRHTRAD
jgi:hypothetical protein